MVTTPRWDNWARTVHAEPARIVSVHNTEDVVAAVTAARAEGLRVKAVGSGHSFTGAAYTDGVLLDLRPMTGLLQSDPVSGRVRVRAGTTLHDLNRLLDVVGLVLTNMGDVDAQTISGAIGTGTHGTGAAFQGLAAGVTGLRIVTADGADVTCSAQERPELFEAARLGLGAYGLITEVELSCVPAFRVRAEESPASLSELLRHLDETMTSTDHVEFFWFPHTDGCLLKRNTRLAPGDDTGEPLPDWKRWLTRDFVDNTVFAGLNRALTLAPGATPRVNRLSAAAMSRSRFTARAHDVFISPRKVRFRESEYAVPRDAAPEILGYLARWFERTGEPVSFPLEVRYAAADDVWLSTAYQRDVAYIAIHQHVAHDHRRAFRAFEDVMARYDGRPHWGKLHRLDAARLGQLYPRFADAMAVRDVVDPDRVFANPYLDRVFGR